MLWRDLPTDAPLEDGFAIGRHAKGPTADATREIHWERFPMKEGCVVVALRAGSQNLDPLPRRMPKKMSSQVN